MTSTVASPAPLCRGVGMLMLQFHPLTGGYETQSLLIACEMVRRQLAVHVVTRRVASLVRHEVYRDVEIHRVQAMGEGHLGALSYLLASFASLAHHRRDYSVLFANRLSSGLVAGIIGFVLQKPVLCRLTSGDEVERLRLSSSWFGRLKLHVLRRSVDGFIALTPKIESDLKAAGISAERIVRIPNGVDLRERHYDDVAIRAELGLAADARVVVFVGRLSADKGVDWLLAAWREVVGAEAGARLIIVGDGPERALLERRARELGVAATVRFVGDQRDVFRFLGVSDVFVLPSRREGISNALLEALSTGLPAVVGDDRFGGNRELVENGENGFVVPLEDVASLRGALLTLIADGDLRRLMGRNGRERVARTAAIETIAERYAEVCDRLLQGLPPANLQGTA